MDPSNIRKGLTSLLSQLRTTGFFHVFGSSIINRIIGFVVVFFIVRILSPEDYGVYTYAFSILSVLLLINGLGVATGILQLCSEKEPGSFQSISLFKYSYRIGIQADCVFAIVLLISTFVISFPLQGANALVRLISFLPLVMLAFELIQIWYRSQGANREYARNITLNSVFLCLFVLGGALLFSSVGAFIGYYLAYLFSALIAFVGMRKTIRLKTQPPSPVEKRTLLKISLASAVTDGTSALLYQIDVIIIGALVTSSLAVAGYRVATLIPVALLFVPSTIMVYLFPYFARNRLDKKWCLRRYLQVTAIVASFSVLITIILILVSKPLISLVFGEAYESVSGVFSVLMISYAFNGGFRIVTGNIICSQRKYLANLCFAVVTVLLFTCLCFILIPLYGIEGAAWSSLATMIITAIMSNVYLVKLLTA